MGFGQVAFLYDVLSSFTFATGGEGSINDYLRKLHLLLPSRGAS